MAFDGFAVSAVKHELSERIGNGYITKITQPEADEINITVKNNGSVYRLVLSANPALPLIYLTDSAKKSPLTAPAFCMLLRKHIGSGHIVGISQPDMDRILVFTIEHRNELGDMCTKKLIFEMMGKYSNIIFTDDNDIILDSVRRVSSHMSSLREVLPGRSYFFPDTLNKKDPRDVKEDGFYAILSEKKGPLAKAVSSSFTGFSYSAAEELLCRAGIDSGCGYEDLPEQKKVRLSECFLQMMAEEAGALYEYRIFYENGSPKEFSVLKSSLLSDLPYEEYTDISGMITSFYSKKEQVSRIRQRSTELRKVVSTALERNARKLSLQEKQLHDTEKMEKYRIWGELINTYRFDAKDGAESMEVLNYYDNTTERIPLDKNLTLSENSQKYYARYNKLKRTAASVSEQIKETKGEIDHLTGISTFLELSMDEADLKDIRDELIETGFIKRTKANTAKGRTKSSYMHYVSSDGFDILVGKNNYQNEEITFKTAQGGDWWFHAKKAAGSHVVVKCGNTELPDRTFEEAASLAAHYSSLGSSDKVEVDYTLRKNVKKPVGGAPGFVVYYTNYSMMAGTDISGLKLVK